MTSYAYHPERAWSELPCGGRALRHDATYEHHYEHVPEHRASRATRAGVRNRADAPINFGQGSRTQMQAGASRGAKVQQDRAWRRITDALARDPSLWRYGCRRLVTGEIVRHKGRPMFAAVCDGIGAREGQCGEASMLPAGSWIARSSAIGLSCCKCASQRGMKRMRAERLEARQIGEATR